MNAQLALPLARNSDPAPSREAARSVAPANSELMRAIVWCAEKRGPVSAFDVVDIIGGHRWDEGTIRSAVSRAKQAGLIAFYDMGGVTPRGRVCSRFTRVSGGGIDGRG